MLYVAIKSALIKVVTRCIYIPTFFGDRVDVANTSIPPLRASKLECATNPDRHIRVVAHTVIFHHLMSDMNIIVGIRGRHFAGVIDINIVCSF